MQQSNNFGLIRFYLRPASLDKIVSSVISTYICCQTGLNYCTIHLQSFFSNHVFGITYRYAANRETFYNALLEANDKCETVIFTLRKKRYS